VIVAKRIITTDRGHRPVRDTGPTATPVSATTVAKALGAETAAATVEDAVAPITLFALRSELLSRLQSSGGRPGLTGTTRQTKIPLGEGEWEQLQELAAAVAVPGCAPSAGQVASVLLGLCVQSVKAQLDQTSPPETAPLARDLAERGAAVS
jgi:hypothetical protein